WYYFTPFIRVLFTFPSRYWFTIGHWRVFSLGGWSPRVHTGFLVSRATQERDRVTLTSCTGLLPSMAALSRRILLAIVIPWLPPYNPRRQAFWFGLFRFRSPLLTESRFLSLPSG